LVKIAKFPAEKNSGLEVRPPHAGPFFRHGERKTTKFQQNQQKRKKEISVFGCSTKIGQFAQFPTKKFF